MPSIWVNCFMGVIPLIPTFLDGTFPELQFQCKLWLRILEFELVRNGISPTLSIYAVCVSFDADLSIGELSNGALIRGMLSNLFAEQWDLLEEDIGEISEV